jgi:allene oxide cyclase
MRHQPMIAALAGAGAALAAVAVTAYGQAPATSSTRTIQLIEKRTAFTLADNGRRGESAGDLGLVSGDLLTASRKRIGRYQGTCVIFKPSVGQTQCTFTLSLPDGQITTQAGYGPGFNGNRVVHEAIVGGTRAYNAARGQVISEETGETTGTLAVQLG